MDVLRIQPKQCTKQNFKFYMFDSKYMLKYEIEVKLFVLNFVVTKLSRAM
jgi:hypothetical protein